MKLFQAIIAVTWMLFSVNGFAGKSEKVLICHVSSEDGTIELINVSANSNHLGNAAHTFAGIYDYEPSEVGASGEGKGDSNDNSVADGCEPTEPPPPPTEDECPCWAEDELESVDSGNVLLDISCATGSTLPDFASIANGEGTTPGVEGGFIAMTTGFNPGSALCFTRDNPDNFMPISDEAAAVCISQIAARCEVIGDPIPLP